MTFHGWLSFDGASLAAIVTSIAALIAALAAWRRSGRNG